MKPKFSHKEHQQNVTPRPNPKERARECLKRNSEETFFSEVFVGDKGGLVVENIFADSSIVRNGFDVVRNSRKIFAVPRRDAIESSWNSSGKQMAATIHCSSDTRERAIR